MAEFSFRVISDLVSGEHAVDLAAILGLCFLSRPFNENAGGGIYCVGIVNKSSIFLHGGAQLSKTVH